MFSDFHGEGMEGWRDGRDRGGDREERELKHWYYSLHFIRIPSSPCYFTHTVTIDILVETKQNNSHGAAWRVLIMGFHRTV